MKVFSGRVAEIQQSVDGKHQAVISLSGGKLPQPGQYLQAHRLIDVDSVVAVTLFPGGIDKKQEENRFTTAPGVPANWQPGDELLLRGPLGKGFALPSQTSRLALAALGDSCVHLLPLAADILARGGEVALFSECSIPQLPAQIEISPLAGLENALLWANFLAAAGTPEQLANLKATLYARKMMPCPAQALVLISMPCGGMAECGVCAFSDRTGKTLLTCEDGPVFDWEQLPETI